MASEAPIDVLLVEDNLGDALLLENSLSVAAQHEFRVVHAMTLAQAIERLSRQPFGLVLLDLSLPDSRGLGTLDKVLPVAGHLPLIVLTGMDDEDAGTQAVQRGAQDYLIKGKVHDDVLVRSIRYAIQRKIAQRALQAAHDELERKVQERTADLSHTLDELQAEVQQRLAAEADLQRLNQILQMVIACNEAIVRIQDEPAMLQEICRIITSIGGYRMAWVGFAEADMSVRPAAWAGAESGYLAGVKIAWDDSTLGQGPTGTAIRTSAACVGEDFLQDPKLAPWREQAIARGYRSSIALPLRSEQTVIGALTIYTQQVGSFDAEKVAVLKQLADDLSFGCTSLRAERERKRLEKEVLDATQREQRRIGQDLHDSIQGDLVGTGFLLTSMASSARKGTLSAEEMAAKADEIREVLARTLQATRGLSRGLCPANLRGPGFLRALEQMASTVTGMFGIGCEVACDDSVNMDEEAVAMQLFYIAQEAVNNAVKHAKPKNVSIQLTRSSDGLRLMVKDDGIGLTDASRPDGMGLRTMGYRARMIGAALSFKRPSGRGTVVECVLPQPSRTT